MDTSCLARIHRATVANKLHTALIALGLNIQWGYGGLFNFGIMGFLMVGGAAVTFISYPVNAKFWNSQGPALLGSALLAALAGWLLVFLAGRVDRGARDAGRRRRAPVRRPRHSAR